MDALKEVKEWLLFKFQTSANKQQYDVNNTKGCSALTPQNIPEFVIPGSGNSSRRTSSECFGDLDLDLDRKRNSYGGRSYTSSPPGSPTWFSPSGSTPCFQMMLGKDCKSAPVTPKHELRGLGGYKRDSHSTLGISRSHDGTNDDPLSFAAMSLPHFRTQTSYGFTTLSETPHTRRKESLFHLGNEPLLPRRPNIRALRNSKLNKDFRESSSPDISLLSTPSMASAHMPSSSMPSVIVTAAQRGSFSRSPSPDIYSFADHCHRRLSPTYRVHSADGIHTIPVPSKYNRFYNRRRSSLQLMTQNGADSSSASEASTPSSYGSMEQVHDQHCYGFGDMHIQNNAVSGIKRHSAPLIQSENNHDTITVHKQQRSSSCQLISRDGPRSSQTRLFAPFGELKFSFQYLPASSQLKVSIIKAENLGGHQKQERPLSSFCRVYLMPGKLQKQTSIVVKRTRNPIFNQDFYFHNIGIDELRTMNLIIKIFSKTLTLKPNEFIGNVTIALDNYDVMVENRIWKDLELSREREEIGFIHCGLKYDHSQGMLCVRVEEAKSLPLHPITGPPNPYVCIEVAQPNRHVMKQQTKTMKNEVNPRFTQTFTFGVSDDYTIMQDTSVTIAVFDHDRIRSDILIGQVVLGCLATEVSQYGHWQDMLDNTGFVISKWHYLVDRDE